MLSALEPCKAYVKHYDCHILRDPKRHPLLELKTLKHKVIKVEKIT